MSLEFVFPAALGKIIGKLPQWPHGIPTSLALNIARKLELLPADLELLEGKTFAIDVQDVGLTVRFRYQHGQFRPLFLARETDLRFSANLVDYLKLVRREEDPDTLFFNRKLLIEGDTELGLAVKNLLDSLEPPTLSMLKDRVLRRQSA